MNLLEKYHLNPLRIPRHVAIIMDGNGRWAKKRGQERVYGHMHGIESVRKTVETAGNLGIEYLTLYTFSTENWQRPKEEVDRLMQLLADTALQEQEKLIQNRIKLKIIGDKTRLPHKVREIFDQVEHNTSLNQSLTLSLALNYGGRAEILAAVRKMISEKPEIPLNESNFERYLQSGQLPDVDLLIRTGGEKRISNFLLWKAAYAELCFLPVLWPDFREEHFCQAIQEYQNRERRYGKTSEQIRNEK